MIATLLSLLLLASVAQADNWILTNPHHGTTVSSSVKLLLEKQKDGLYGLICEQEGKRVDCNIPRFFCENDEGKKIPCEGVPVYSWRVYKEQQ